MSLLSNVTSGKQIGAQIHVIAGHNGVGKTTWAAGFPNPLILDLENGSSHLDVARVPANKLTSLSEFRAGLKELIESNHDFKTVAIDSVEALEHLISDSICKEHQVGSLEDLGYGKGYAKSREVMREIMSDLQVLKAKGITSILIAHTQVKSHTDPATNQTYDRVIMRANDKLAAVIRDFADNVFFATFKVFTTKDGNKTKAFGDGQRVMYAQPRPGFDAKNRLELPLEMDLSYAGFAQACEDAKVEDSASILSDIEEMSKQVDEKLKKTVAEQVEKFKNDPAKLKQVKNRLMKYVA